MRLISYVKHVFGSFPGVCTSLTPIIA